jgi:MYXO-CTERM domain-containing protein
VQEGVSQASGLSGDQTKRLLMILAPIALAALAARRRQDPDDDEDDARIGGVLERETAEAQRKAEEREPGVGGLLGKFLALGTRPPRA